MTRCAHLSLKYDVDPDAIGHYIAEVIKVEGARLVTTTEASREMARATERRVGPGFAVARVGEHLFVWERATFGKGGPLWLAPVTLLPFFNPRGRLLTFLVASVRLTWRGRPFRVQAGHGPSAVQAGNDWSGAKLRVLAARDGYQRWGRKVRRWSRRHPHGVQVLPMDSNLDQRNARWRWYLADVLGCRSVWEGHQPERGSHGDRLIDTAHVRGAQVVEAHLCRVDPPRGVDHHGIVFTLD